METLYLAKERELIGEISSLFLSVELYSYFSWEFVVLVCGIDLQVVLLLFW